MSFFFTYLKEGLIFLYFLLKKKIDAISNSIGGIDYTDTDIIVNDGEI